MKTLMTMAPPLLGDVPTTCAPSTSLAPRMAAYVALTKPRIITMVLVTVAVGYVLGCRNQAGPDWSNFLFTLVGTGLVAGGASAWNQYLERFRDSRMRRTAKRPLPSGKIEPIEAVLVGTFLTLLGVALLGLGSEPLAAGVAAVTFLLYVFLYTPLKPYTTLNTAVGAIPGALPPVIGWVAATGRLGIEAWALFLIVFLWQFPHFLAIAWLYRQDYSRAGFLMLPCRDPDGWRTGRHASSYALALVPVVLLPSALGLAGGLYFAGALLLSLFYLVSATRFWCQVNDRTARGLLRASIIHLPSTLMLLLLNSTVV